MGFYDTEASITTRPHEQKTAYPRSSFVESGYRYYSPTLGRWINRDPIGENGGLSLYGAVVNSPVSLVDTLGLSWWNPISWFRGKDKQCKKAGGKGTDKRCCCNRKTFDPSSQCCEQGKIVAPVTIYIINREGVIEPGRVRGGALLPSMPELTGGHIDLILPTCGMIGFFGAADEPSLYGMVRQPGMFIGTPDEWWARRRGSMLGTGGGIVSTICEIRVCPSREKEMCEKYSSMRADPPSFMPAGGNCSSRACDILGAGGVDCGAGLDCPSNLIDEMKEQGASCYKGFTGLGMGGNPMIFPMLGDVTFGPGGEPRGHVYPPRLLPYPDQRYR